MLSLMVDSTAASTDHNLNPTVLKLLGYYQFICATGVVMSSIAMINCSSLSIHKKFLALYLWIKVLQRLTKRSA